MFGKLLWEEYFFELSLGNIYTKKIEISEYNYLLGRLNRVHLWRFEEINIYWYKEETIEME